MEPEAVLTQLFTETSGWKCPDCEEFVEDGGEFEPLYECGECSTRFTKSNSSDGASHMCPNDYKYSKKVTEHGCMACGEGEMDEHTTYQCTLCEEKVDDDDRGTHLEDAHPECWPKDADEPHVPTTTVEQIGKEVLEHAIDEGFIDDRPDPVLD